MRVLLLATLFLMIVNTALIAQAPVTQIRTVGRIDFVGNTVISDETLMQESPLRPGELLTQTRLEQALLAVQESYKQRGYLAAIDETLLEGFQETGVLQISIIEVRVSEVRIEGLTRTREDAVRRLLELQPGNIYNVFTLRRDADRLHALDTFTTIDASIEPGATPSDVVVVWILQDPERTGNVQLGGSYSPREGVVGTVTVVDTNFRGRLQRIGASLSLDTRDARISWNVFYYNPWIAPRTALDTRAFSAVQYRFNRDLVTDPSSDTYFERRTGALLGLLRGLTHTRQGSLVTRYENVNVRNFPVDSFVPDIPPVDGSIFAVAGGYLFDNRDSILYPTVGRVWRAYLEPGWVSPDDGGSTVIAKANGLWAGFYSLDRQLTKPLQEEPPRHPRVIATRFRVGTSVGELPFYEQYFVGGVGSLRGYLESRFWGKHMFLGTVEYRQPITAPLWAIAFVDVGDAWGSDYQFLDGVETDFDQHDGISPRFGVGVGVRYESPLGILGVDFAWGEEFRTTLTFGEAL